MKQKKITLLNEHGYQHFIRQTTDGIGYTHLAQITDGKRPHRVYLSVYPGNTHNKSLVNEITAHLLATALNLPVAKDAFVLVANIQLLRTLYPHIQFTDHETHYPVWGIGELSGNSPKYHYNLSRVQHNPSFIEDINKWDKLLDTIAFDEWLGNSDRNTGNLIRTGKSRYALIDHEDIAGSKQWHTASLDPKQEIINKLAIIIWGNYNVHDKKQTNMMIHRAGKHMSANISILQELVYWWKLLLPEHELNALHKFIMKRSITCPEQIKIRYGALL